MTMNRDVGREAARDANARLRVATNVSALMRAFLSLAESIAYGRLSIMAQWLCETEFLFHINPRAFTPPPAVQSTVVRLTPRANPIAVRRETLERVTAAAFGQRRKMLRQSLRAVEPDAETLCRAVDIDPTARAETLTVAQFCALANMVDRNI